MPPIRALQRLDDTILRLGGSGDNWHTTWAADESQFTSLCDGSGWLGLARAARLHRAVLQLPDLPPASTTTAFR